MADSLSSKKRELVELVVAKLQQELESLTESARAAHEAATHEESKAEDAHDTRGLEASYLAGAQAARIEGLRKVIAGLRVAEYRDFAPIDAIAPGALVEVDLDGRRAHYLIVGHGGGQSITYEGRTIQVITPQAPLGEALLGRRAGDAVEVEAQRVTREYEIVSVR